MEDAFSANEFEAKRRSHTTAVAGRCRRYAVDRSVLSSPLIVEDMVIVAASGRLAAL